MLVSRIVLITLVLALLPACKMRSSLVPESADLRIPVISRDGVEIKLPSGLRVLVERDTRAPFVGVFTFVGAGSSSEPKGKEGLAHFVEHLVFRARPYGKATFEGLLEQAGAARWNGMTNEDSTRYYEMGPADAMPELLRLAGARLVGPLEGLLPDDIEIEREIVRAELHDRWEFGSSRQILGAMHAAIFPADHPYARAGSDDMESLASLTLDDAKSFVRDHYRPQDITMVVLGDVDVKEVEQTVNTFLPRELVAAPPEGALPRAQAGKRIEPPEPPPGPTALLRIEAPVITPELWVGWSLPGSLFDTEQQLRLLSRALSAHLSRAFADAPEFDGVGAGLFDGREASMLLVSATLLDASKPAKSLDRILGEVARMAAPPADSDEARKRENVFLDEQRRAILDALLGMEHPTSHALDMAQSAHFTGDPSWYLRSVNDLAGAKPKQITDLVAKYLGRKRARAIYVVPAKARAQAPANAKASGHGAVGQDDERPLLQVDAERIRRIAEPRGFAGYRQYKLPNGLEVIIGHRSEKPLVTATLLFRGSPRSLPSPAEGIMALDTSRADATPKGKGSGAFGGAIERHVRTDRIEYSVQAAKGNTASMLATLARYVQSMKVRGKRFLENTHERAKNLEKISQEPDERGERAFWRGLYGSHPLARVVLPSEILRVDADTAQAWLEKHHAPRNAVLVVVGDVVPKEVERVIEEVFGDWEDEAPAREPPALPKIEEKRADKPQIFVMNRPGATRATIHFGCLLPPLQGRSPAKYDLMAKLVQTQLHSLLRRRQGMTYTASGHAAIFWGGLAHLSIRADADQARLGEALVVLRDVLRELEEGKFPPGELDRARLKLAREHLLSHVTNEEVVEALLHARRTGLSLGIADQYGNALAAVTPEDIIEGFRRCAAGKPTLSLVGEEALTRAAAAAAFP